MSFLEPGQVFAGRYRVERFLARGGFGAVYVAEQLATEARVALKVLLPHVLDSESATASFEQEARIAGRLNSEYIVRVIDAGVDTATSMPFLAMELLVGEDLQRVVEQTGPIAPELVLMYARQIAAALDKAHHYVDREGRSRPIIHRDLKPENLFLTRRETGEPVVKILDFGIAKVLTESMQASQEVKGTPLYMSFEQATGQKVAAGTDVWALGLIVFFLLSGKNYWKSAHSENASLHQVFGEVMTMPMDTPTLRAGALGGAVPWPPTFDAWFLRCVNRTLSQRFPSAGEAVTALAHALDGSQDLSLSMALDSTLPGGVVRAMSADPLPVSGPPESKAGLQTEPHGGLESAIRSEPREAAALGLQTELQGGQQRGPRAGLQSDGYGALGSTKPPELSPRGLRRSSLLWAAGATALLVTGLVIAAKMAGTGPAPTAAEPAPASSASAMAATGTMAPGVTVPAASSAPAAEPAVAPLLASSVPPAAPVGSGKSAHATKPGKAQPKPGPYDDR